jgi:hypothetical protein
VVLLYCGVRWANGNEVWQPKRLVLHCSASLHRVSQRRPLAGVVAPGRPGQMDALETRVEHAGVRVALETAVVLDRCAETSIDGRSVSEPPEQVAL